MKVSEIGWGRQITGTLSAVIPDISREDENHLVAVDYSAENDALAVTLSGARLVRVKAVGTSAVEFVEEVRAAGSACVCWLLRADASSLTLQAHLFPKTLSFAPDDPLVLKVDDAILESLPPNARTREIEFLTEEFLLEDMAFARMGAEGQYQLLGPNWVCDVRTDAYDDLRCVRLAPNRRRQQFDEATPITLLRGAIQFAFYGLSEAAGRAMGRLREALTEHTEYLAIWGLYNDLERYIRRDEAIKLGCLEYTRRERRVRADDVTYVFDLAEAAPSALFAEEIDLEASTDPFLHDASDDYFLTNSAVFLGKAERVPGAPRRIQVTRLQESGIEGDPPPHGFLFRSLRGDVVRLKRRNAALQRIQAGVNPLPTLPLLLEFGKAPQSGSVISDPLSVAARQAMGGHEPTQSQMEALSVALNSPDLALIQGPPGTGKTSVIRALITRLAELRREKRGKTAAILITSYQHDAVDNAVQGIDIAGLPSNRVGGRRGDTHAMRERGMWDWIEGKQSHCEEILASLGGRPALTLARDVDGLIDQWRNIRGGRESVAILLNDVLTRTVGVLPTELTEGLRRALLSFRRSSPQTGPADGQDQAILLQQLEKLLSSQRLTPEGFLDDGPFQARRLMKFLSGIGAMLGLDVPAGVKTATEADSIASTDEGVSALLDGLRDGVALLRGESIGNREALEETRDNVVALEELLAQVSRALHTRSREGSEGVAEAIAAFREDIENPEAVQGLIEKYSGVMAGTCQQVVPSKMGRNWPVYDVVIVDEAARANPLDLIIPMSIAKKIILVGDHKQLPHILEEEVVSEFATQQDDKAVSFLKESLFERLFRLCQQDERAGGPRRTMTLLDDFRMHPTIGSFVSRTFYNSTVLSRRSEADRAHELPLYDGKPVAWLDVPMVRGRETGGQSRSRPAEVAVIMAEVEQILRANTVWTVGIITFYSKQATLLEEEVERLPVDWKHRILVGTVDAFQGREFDVVFLSTVRSNPIRDDLRRRVGFLALPSRLCVAFSRARRLLVGVGDADTVAGTSDEPAVEEIKAYVELCRGEEGYNATRKG